jgi:hypothetical protein
MHGISLEAFQMKGALGSTDGREAGLQDLSTNVVTAASHPCPLASHDTGINEAGAISSP